jgi:hypothetical protein
LEESFTKIVDSYYPDVDMKKLDEKVKNLNSISCKDISSKYSDLMSNLKSVKDILSDYKTKISDKF